MYLNRLIFSALLAAYPLCAQTADDPFPNPISANGDPILVDFVEFVAIPDSDGEPARLMHLVDEPGTHRLFVNDQRGPLYVISYDGQTVTEYLNVNDPRWEIEVEYSGRERGVQSFTVHPQFGQPGQPGFGKLYTWTDTNNTAPTADFIPQCALLYGRCMTSNINERVSGTRVESQDTHDTVLLEWTARDPTAARYDGDAPRELIRFEQPFGNHNGGQIGFNPLTSAGDQDFGLLYVGIADGGSGGDPLSLSQSLSSAFGKIFRIDPLGSNSVNGEYGIPNDNPFAEDNDPNTLGEVYAYGVRNPQRFAWDPENGNMFLADIGQNIVEEISLVSRGANLGWNIWEGSFGWISRQEVDLAGRRGDPSVTYPVAEYGQLDPLLQPQSAASGVHVYRGDAISQLTDLVLFNDLPSGELFYINADELPDGGQNSIRRILLNDGGEAKTILQVIREKNAEQGRDPATRVDLHLASGPDGQVLLLNKHDGVVRMLVPDYDL